jgi:hypothetical protein
VKLTKKAREAAKKQKSQQNQANMEQAIREWNKLTPAQKKAKRKWGN